MVRQAQLKGEVLGEDRPIISLDDVSETLKILSLKHEEMR